MATQARRPGTGTVSGMGKRDNRLGKRKLHIKSTKKIASGMFMCIYGQGWFRVHFSKIHTYKKIKKRNVFNFANRQRLILNSYIYVYFCIDLFSEIYSLLLSLNTVWIRGPIVGQLINRSVIVWSDTKSCMKQKISVFQWCNKAHRVIVKEVSAWLHPLQ